MTDKTSSQGDTFRQAVEELFSDGRVVLFRWAASGAWPVEFVTPSITSVLGYSPDDFLGGPLDFSSLIHPDDFERVNRDINHQSALGVKVFTHDHYRLRHQNGTYIWVEDHTYIIRDDAGEITHYLGYLVDVTERRIYRETLEAHNEILDTTLASIRQGVAAFDAELKLTSWNQQFFDIMDYPDDLARMGTDLEDFLRFNAERGDYGPDGAEGHVQDRIERATTNRPHRYERQAPGGRVVEVMGNPMPGGGFVATYTDITEMKTAKDNLQNQLTFLDTLINTIPNPIYYCNREGLFEGCNRAFEKAIGIRTRELNGGSWADILPDELARTMTEQERDIMETRSFKMAEDKFPYADGSNRDVFVSKSSFMDSKGRVRGVLSVMTDITERKKLERELRRLASTDPLTNAANRRQFIQYAEKERNRLQRHERPITVALLDIDHFKKVNDTYGHAIGDRVLVDLVKECVKMLRTSDMVGRLGGEEFGILLPETHMDHAMDVMERLRLKIADMEIGARQGPFNITVSIGVDVWDYENEELEIALSKADKALYAAKQSGRNKVLLFDTSMDGR